MCLSLAQKVVGELLLLACRLQEPRSQSQDAKEITPRSYQRIKAKCVQVTAEPRLPALLISAWRRAVGLHFFLRVFLHCAEEIDAKLSQLKRRTPKSPQPTQKSAPRLRKAASGSSLGTVQEWEWERGMDSHGTCWVSLDMSGLS